MQLFERKNDSISHDFEKGYHFRSKGPAPSKDGVGYLRADLWTKDYLANW